jgi:hypothetical protein
MTMDMLATQGKAKPSTENIKRQKAKGKTIPIQVWTGP